MVHLYVAVENLLSKLDPNIIFFVYTAATTLAVLVPALFSGNTHKTSSCHNLSTVNIKQLCFTTRNTQAFCLVGCLHGDQATFIQVDDEICQNIDISEYQYLYQRSCLEMFGSQTVFVDVPEISKDGIPGWYLQSSQKKPASDSPHKHGPSGL